MKRFADMKHNVYLPDVKENNDKVYIRNRTISIFQGYGLGKLRLDDQMSIFGIGL